MAVHPDDERYKKFHGTTLIHPFSDRKVPVILDPVLVDMEFGTGAVKVSAADIKKSCAAHQAVVRCVCRGRGGIALCAVQ